MDSTKFDTTLYTTNCTLPRIRSFHLSVYVREGGGRAWLLRVRAGPMAPWSFDTTHNIQHQAASFGLL